MDLGLYSILLGVLFVSLLIGIYADEEIPGVLGLVGLVGLLIVGTIFPSGKWTHVKHSATSTIVNDQMLVQAKDPKIESIIETNMKFIGKEVDIVEIQQRNVWGGHGTSTYQVELKGKAEQ